MSCLKISLAGLAAASVVGMGSSASAEMIYGLTTQNGITVFDSGAPRDSLDGGFVSGLSGGENLVALDYRPSNGQVYAISSADNLYTIDQTTFAASLVGSFAPPSLRGTSFGFDFNPAFQGGEFARFISDTDNNRVISGDTGQYLPPVEKTPAFYAAGDPNEGENPNIAGIGYTNSLGVPNSTQQFGIDATLGVLVTVANNAGTLNTVGSLGLSTLTDELGFDISGDSDIAYATLQNSPNSELYSVNLSNGSATLLGTITSGDLIRDITVIPIPEPSTGLLFVALGGLAGLRRRTKKAA